jgi:VIT1/CCC1 family predicted Fe2+/Mn2+ transporter
VLGRCSPVRSGAGNYIKSAIYGGLDGIMEMFVVVAGVTGGSLDPRVPIILGFASLIADAMSMSIGDLLSTRAELEFAQAERKREMWCVMIVRH